VAVFDPVNTRGGYSSHVFTAIYPFWLTDVMGNQSGLLRLNRSGANGKQSVRGRTGNWRTR
jgi:hypothetical protein